MSTRLDKMVETALDSKRRYAVASSWRAEVVTPRISTEPQVNVWHYDTLMFCVRKYDGEWYAYPISNGKGSTSDRCGIAKILRGVQCANADSYADLYGKVPLNGGEV